LIRGSELTGLRAFFHVICQTLLAGSARGMMEYAA
jgi:hypothetical protein